jgi:hypothetical protein
MRTLLAWLLALLVGAGLWMPVPAAAQSGNTWQVDFYANGSWRGRPTYTTFANVLNFNWGRSAPGPRLPTMNWSARMSSRAFFYAATYRVYIVADDAFTLLVDGEPVYTTQGMAETGKAQVFDLPMTQGLHDVQVEYLQLGGAAYFSMDWQILKAPGVARALLQPLPEGAVAPTPVITAYGDYTPCIQQQLHQSRCFVASGDWNSPNLGSIVMEPAIVVWGACTADTVTMMRLVNGQADQAAKCSKTEAGWYPQ